MPLVRGNEMAEQTKQGATAPAANAITAKEAVAAAAKYFVDVTGITAGVSVEEVELSEDGKYWMVTLGFRDPRDFASVFAVERRDYKKFKIHAVTGAVVSMKIRES